MNRRSLIIADANDKLALRISKLVPNAVHCSIAEFSASSEFALGLAGPCCQGWLTIGGQRLRFSQLTAVLFRSTQPPRPLWAFEAHEAFFAYQEWAAAWCALLDSLPCPVFNRYSAAWWAGDPHQGLFIRESLAGKLKGLQIPVFMQAFGYSRRCPQTLSVFLVGPQLLTARGACAAANTGFNRFRCAIRQWQKQWGIGFCRIDFPNGVARDLRIDLCPLLRSTDADTLDRVAGLVAAGLL